MTRTVTKPKSSSHQATDTSSAPTRRPKPKATTGRAIVPPKPHVPAPAPRRVDTHSLNGGQPVQRTRDTQRTGGGLLLTIKTLGNLLDDLERVRIMNDNRIGALEREHGSSLPELEVIAEQLRAVEHVAELNLKRAWRRHPLAPWAKTYPGIGEKLIARLIAEIGDPATRPNPAKLHAYCGIGDPARKRRTGMTQEEAFKLGNPKAKKLCWNIGESFTKKRCKACTRAARERPGTDWTPPPVDCTCREEGCIGRVRYDERRSLYADRVHATACVRCGPSGKPAAPGSPWSLKHQHEAAKRYAVKQFLKELWIASRHMTGDDQSRCAGGES